MKFRKIRKNKLVIPDNDMNGLTDSLIVQSDHVVKEIMLHAELDHDYPGDLSIELISPSGTRETVLSPGNNQDKAECFCLPVTRPIELSNGSSKGEWTIRLIDTGIKDQGSLISWELDFVVEKKSADILIEDQCILEIHYNYLDEALVQSLDIELEIEHEHIGDLKVSILCPDGYEKTLHDKEGKDQTDLELNFNSYQLSDFKNRQAKGIWKVIIKDLLKGDTGVLKNWSIQLETNQ